MEYKGIILAGGMATRLMPVSKYISKQLLPIYDKPLIYYPLSILMMAKIRDIMIIVNQSHKGMFKELLGDGSKFGINIKYKIQKKPNGIAESFILAERFINKSNVALVLGDNLFYGRNFINQLLLAKNKKVGSTVFTCRLNNPEEFGVVKLNNNNQPIKIIEKPKKYVSNQVITGLYFYDNRVVRYAKNLKPSKRNELEITDINNIYIKEKKMEIVDLGRGFAWFDTGTYEKMLEASNFVKTIESSHGLKIACLEEIAYQNKWINRVRLLKIIKNEKNFKTKSYLSELIK